MAPFKAPGIDGMHAGFYQHMWEYVGDTVCGFAMEFFDLGILPAGVNDTLLTLIPKV